jgi:hypothetical protein
MAEPTVSDLVIKLSPSTRGSRWTFSSPHITDSPDLTFDSKWNPGKGIDHSKNLRAALEGFTETIGPSLDHSGGLEKVGQAVVELLNEGTSALVNLFEAWSSAVKRFSTEACSKGKCRGGRAFATIEVQVDGGIDAMPPIEFLPLLLDDAQLDEDEDDRLPTQVKNKATLFKTIARFPGFAGIVRRLLLPRDDVDLQLGLPHGLPHGASLEIVNDDGLLPLKLFHDAGLAGARLEKEFFKANSHCLDVDGQEPWPTDAISDDDFPRELAKSLWKRNHSVTGGTRNPPDEIHHFACHCATESADSLDYTLKLANSSHEFGVTIKQLQSQYGQLNRKDPHEWMPLVFLSACGSAGIKLGRDTSFPDLFLRLRSRGFIGTAAAIPDKFAAGFSQHFYKHLLELKTLGEAIFLARWDMLAHYWNPMGLLYVVYANTDMQATKRAKINLLGA